MAENIYSFLSLFRNVKQTGQNQWLCQCPAHYDKKSSLSVSYNTLEDKIALHCHAGCATSDILTEVGRTFADIMPTKEERKKPLQKWQINLKAEYRYTDADGKYLYSKLRYEGEGIEGKQIRYGRVIDDKYVPGKGEIKGELYNLRKMREAVNKGKTIYYCEGEKDVETLRDIGLTAVTAGGTADWRKDFIKHFVGVKDVVILADNDNPGAALAETVANDLRNVVYQIRTVVPSKNNHGDVTDWLLDEGGTAEDLLKLVKSTDPQYAYWSNDKGKVNPSLLADAILSMEHAIVARNPGTKSDQLLWWRHGVYVVSSMTEVEAEVDKYLPAYVSNPTTLQNTAKMLMIRAKAIKYEDINADERYINVRNGLIRVPELELVPHDPQVLSTIQLACEYDPKAKAPVWESFKRDFCRDEDGNVDEEMLRFDRMKGGIILSGLYGHRFKAAFVQYSTEGNTGKSVDCDVYTNMLGFSNVANVSFQEMSDDRWAKGRIWGKRLVIVGDQGRDSIRESKTFKEITGGDPIEAELKGLQHFLYRFTGVILVSCNHLPVFDDDKGDHMAERLRFLHCRNVIEPEDRDEFLRDKLAKERSGILNWALGGLKDFIDNGYKFSRCQSSDALMDEYRCKYDTFYRFIQECCVVTKDDNDSIAKTDFEERYLEFCQREGVTASKRNVKDRAVSHGIKLKYLHGYPVYKGICFKDSLPQGAVAGTGFENYQEEIPF